MRARNLFEQRETSGLRLRRSKRVSTRSFALAGAMLLAGCSPNLYSLPFFTTTTIHNEPALRFLKDGGPATVGGAGPGLSVKDPFADGRVVALTASGGGMRATAFTLGILAELDETLPPGQGRSALEEVDMISSVSGGSWAIASMLTVRAGDRDGALAKAFPRIEKSYAALQHAKVKHWAEPFIPAVTGGLTYKDVYRAGATRPLPFVYFNASLYPSHSPFVFTPAYLDHYKVKTLGDPASSSRIQLRTRDLTGIPIGYAATASSAVPGYTSAFAETGLCQVEPRPSFCFGNKERRDNLQILDGGLYDNIGYKTALEVALAERERIARGPATLIMIDSADGEDFQTMPAKDREGGHVLGIAKASSFPNQNATFDRLRGPSFAAAGFDARILLDFSSAAGFNRVRHGPLLQDLPELAYYAAHDVGCWADDRSWHKGVRALKRPPSFGTPDDNLSRLEKMGEDCISMNFARVGYLYKTTFKYDEYRFRLNYQVGRLVVRMKRSTIVDASSATREVTRAKSRTDLALPSPPSSAAAAASLQISKSLRVSGIRLDIVTWMAKSAAPSPLMSASMMAAPPLYRVRSCPAWPVKASDPI